MSLRYVVPGVVIAGVAAFVGVRAALPARDPASFTVTTYHEGVLDEDGTFVRLITPKAESAPGWDGTRLLPGDGVVRLLEALGPLDLGACATTAMSRRVVRPLERSWKEISDRAAAGPPADPPVRLLFRQYARPELEGECVTVACTLYTIPDPALDHPDRDPQRTPPDPKNGFLMELRKTYQLDGSPRIIEAAIEVHEHPTTGVGRSGYGAMCEQEVDPVARDPSVDGRFDWFGGGIRHGLFWYDRSLGLGEPDPRSGAFVIHVDGMSVRPPVVDVEDVPAVLGERILAFLRRL